MVCWSLAAEGAVKLESDSGAKSLSSLPSLSMVSSSFPFPRMSQSSTPTPIAPYV